MEIASVVLATGMPIWKQFAIFGPASIILFIVMFGLVTLLMGPAPSLATSSEKQGSSEPEE